jgi:hypothetical protein
MNRARPLARMDHIRATKKDAPTFRETIIEEEEAAAERDERASLAPRTPVSPQKSKSRPQRQQQPESEIDIEAAEAKRIVAAAAAEAAEAARVPARTPSRPGATVAAAPVTPVVAVRSVSVKGSEQRPVADTPGAQSLEVSSSGSQSDGESPRWEPQNYPREESMQRYSNPFSIRGLEDEVDARKQ